MPPPSSGGVALIEMLNMLEAFDLKAKGPAAAEARAPGDRGDAPRVPRSRALPGRPRLRRSAARSPHCRRPTRSTLSATIDPARASRAASSSARTSSTTPQQRARRDDALLGDRPRRHGGRNTFTLEGGFGSQVVVKGAGFLLNNEMGDFNKKPGVTDARRHHRHAGQPDRSGQAHAQLDDADDRVEERQGRARHRLARRPHDHQHRAQRRARA